MRIYSLCGPNKKSIVSISVGIVMCRSIWNSKLVVAESWLLPHRDTSRKPWVGSVSREVTQKILAKYLLESQLLII